MRGQIRQEQQFDEGPVPPQPKRLNVVAYCFFVCVGLVLVVDGLLETSHWRWRHAVATATACEWQTTKGRNSHTYQACTVEWTLAEARHVGHLDYSEDADPYHEQVPVSVHGDSVQRTSDLRRRAITEPIIGGMLVLGASSVLGRRRRVAAPPAP